MSYASVVAQALGASSCVVTGGQHPASSTAASFAAVDCTGFCFQQARGTCDIPNPQPKPQPYLPRSARQQAPIKRTLICWHRVARYLCPCSNHKSDIHPSASCVIGLWPLPVCDLSTAVRAAVAGPEADVDVFEGAELYVIPANETLTFEHTYTWWGECSLWACPSTAAWMLTGPTVVQQCQGQG